MSDSTLERLINLCRSNGVWQTILFLRVTDLTCVRFDVMLIQTSMLKLMRLQSYKQSLRLG